MASWFGNHKHDDYMTPEHAWDNVKQFIPKDKLIWEAFYGDGNSGKILTKLGFNVIHKKIDFYENNLGEIIVSNPPFSDAKKVMNRMLVLDKPFMLIMPAFKITTSYMRAWADKNIQIIIPRKRINFIKIKNGVVDTEAKGASFDCFYYCYKLGLPKDILWLE